MRNLRQPNPPSRGLLLGCQLAVVLSLLLIGNADGRTPFERKSSESQKTKQPIKVEVSPDPPVLLYDKPGQSKVGHLIITAEGIDVTSLQLRSKPLVLGTNRAFVQFNDRAVGESISLDDAKLQCKPRDTCKVEYRVSGVLARGEYIGTVEAFTKATKHQTATITALLPDPGFLPTISGEWFKNGRLEFDSASQKSFRIRLSSPVGSPFRQYRLSGSVERQTDVSWIGKLESMFFSRVVEKRSLPLGFEPANVELDSNGTRSVVVSSVEELEAGSYIGAVTLVDISEPTLSMAVDVVMTVTAPERWRRFYLFGWTLTGALISVLLNNILPLARSKGEKMELLRSFEGRVRQCSAVGPNLRAGLLAEVRRLWLLANEISFYDFRKTVRLDEIKKSIEVLDTLIRSAEEINLIRANMEKAIQPISVLLEVGIGLGQAEDALLQSDNTRARSYIDNASKQLDAAPSLENLRLGLKRDIGKLLKERPNGGVAVDLSAEAIGRSHHDLESAVRSAVEAGRPREIAGKVAQIEVDQMTLGDATLAELLAIERDFYVAEVWTNVIEFALNYNDETDRFGEQVKRYLCECLVTSPVSQQTQGLLSLVRVGISPLDINEALRCGAGRIVCELKPRYHDLVRFEFTFLDQALAGVPSARKVCSFQWSFDDDTTPGEDGEACRHFFLPVKDRGRWSSWPWQLKRAQEVRVSVAIPFGELWAQTILAPYVFTQRLTMRDRREQGRPFLGMQVFTFFLATGIAVLGAFGTQYSGSVPGHIDWSVCTTALLFGFGIDQIRDRTSGAAP